MKFSKELLPLYVIWDALWLWGWVKLCLGNHFFPHPLEIRIIKCLDYVFPMVFFCPQDIITGWWEETFLLLTCTWQSAAEWTRWQSISTPAAKINNILLLLHRFSSISPFKYKNKTCRSPHKSKKTALRYQFARKGHKESPQLEYIFQLKDSKFTAWWETKSSLVILGTNWRHSLPTESQWCCPNVPCSSK